MVPPTVRLSWKLTACPPWLSVTVRFVTPTVPEKAVPFDCVTVRVPTPETAPATVTAPVAPPSRVRSFVPPVTAPRLTAPPPDWIIVSLSRVTAPRVMVSPDAAMVPTRFRLPGPPVRSTPPLKVKVSPTASPMVMLPVFRNVTAFVTVPPPKSDRLYPPA